MFENKVVVVTGGAKGIGRAIAEEFRKAGAIVCVIDLLENDYYSGDLAEQSVLENFARRVIADPIYARLLPDEKEKFVSMPHEAYSGRHYHDDMPIFVGPSFTAWMKEKLT